jgi:hypothetical protein
VLENNINHILKSHLTAETFGLNWFFDNHDDIVIANHHTTTKFEKRNEMEIMKSLSTYKN